LTAARASGQHARSAAGKIAAAPAARKVD